MPEIHEDFLPAQAMKSQLERLALLGSLFLVLCSVLFIVNQTAQVVSLASALSPILGKIVLVGLVGVFGTAILIPFAMFARMSPSVRPPLDAQSTEYPIYLSRLSKRLRRNPHLANTHLQLIDRDEIEAALKILDAHANGVIKKSASKVL